MSVELCPEVVVVDELFDDPPDVVFVELLSLVVVVPVVDVLSPVDVLSFVDVPSDEVLVVELFELVDVYRGNTDLSEVVGDWI